MWMMYAPGSGVWFNTGNTRTYDDEETAESDLCGPRPDDYKETKPYIARMTPCARKAGLSSIQFKKTYNQGDYFELVSFLLSGLHKCGQEGGGVLPDDIIRAG